jgi:hypothetical protein
MWEIFLAYVHIKKGARIVNMWASARQNIMQFKFMLITVKINYLRESKCAGDKKMYITMMQIKQLKISECLPKSNDILRIPKDYRIVTRVTNITITILNIIHRPVFYLKHTMDIVRTSLESRCISATGPTG